MKVAVRFAALAAFAVLLPASAYSQDLIVEKKTFEMPSYTTVGGQTIKNVKIGWQAAGTLNADRSNVILITHFFSGTSHAFGKYKADDKVAGYWDPIVGPGKAIDTNKYYVISADTLVNLSPNAANVVTTGPASINPDTGKPYGMTFPIVTMRDFVNVQKALLESLGIKKLKVVAGASMGGLQVYEWAAGYPEMVEKIIPVIAAAEPGPYLMGWLNVWAAPIMLDPKWNGGDYYGKEAPNEGLAQSLKIVTLHANQWQWAEKAFGMALAKEGDDPAKNWGAKFKIEATLDAAGKARAAVSDANHFLYLVKANHTYSADITKIKAPTLMIYAPSDLVFTAEIVEQGAKKIAANGTPVQTVKLEGPNGHLLGVIAIAQAKDQIAAFIEK